MHVRKSLGVSERRSCHVIGQHRSTQRKRPQEKVDEELLTGDIIKLAREYGRYGYRRIAVLLKNAGWLVNAKRVERICRREGLKVPMKQPKRGRLWFNDGSCVRLRALRPKHVWSYDFVHDRTYDEKHSEHSTFWTNTRVNVWQSGWIENSTHRMFSMY